MVFFVYLLTEDIRYFIAIVDKQRNVFLELSVSFFYLWLN